MYNYCWSALGGAWMPLEASRASWIGLASSWNTADMTLLGHVSYNFKLVCLLADFLKKSVKNYNGHEECVLHSGVTEGRQKCHQSVC